MQEIKKAASLSLALARIVTVSSAICSKWQTGIVKSRKTKFIEPFSMKHHLFFFGQGRVACRRQNHGSRRIPTANGYSLVRFGSQIWLSNQVKVNLSIFGG